MHVHVFSALIAVLNSRLCIQCFESHLRITRTMYM